MRTRTLGLLLTLLGTQPNCAAMRAFQASVETIATEKRMEGDYEVVRFPDKNGDTICTVDFYPTLSSDPLDDSLVGGDPWVIQSLKQRYCQEFKTNQKVFYTTGSGR